MAGAAARILIPLLTTAISLATAEAVVRIADGGALPALGIFEAGGAAGVRLQADAHARGLRRGGTFDVTTGPDGLRRRGDGAWSGGVLVVGDSQVLGLGVEDGETFAAVATARGAPLGNAGVVGHGVQDALRHAADLLDALEPRPTGVVVVANQANDWDEVGEPVTARFAVAGGFLVQPHAWAAQRWFLASPLARVHVLHYAVVAVHQAFATDAPRPPLWADPVAARTATAGIAAAVADFAAAHPGVDVRVAFLPLDVAASAERADASILARQVAHLRPWEDGSLPAGLGSAVAPVPFLDLTGPLRGCATCFLPGDYHLSPEGHARVGEALAAWLGAR